MRGSSPRGLTLIELMVTLVIAGVLLSLGLPSFRESVVRARLSSSATELMAALQTGRADAVRMRRNVVICRSTDGLTCSSADNRWTGWMMFIDSDANGTRGSSEPVLRVGSFDDSVEVRSSPTITARGEQIIFSGDGMARATDGRTLLNGTMSVCTVSTRPAENARDLAIGSGSRITLRRRNGAGACATPGDT